MELTLWTYEGPPHVGAMRIAASMEGVHYVLHAPQGDTYADLLFTMIERRDRRPPVTYTTFQARDLGGDTAELVKRSIAGAVERFQPEALLVGESCTAELIQDQPGALAAGMDLGGIPVVSLDLPAYSKKENWGGAETLYQLVRGLLKAQVPPPGEPKPDPSRWRAKRLGIPCAVISSPLHVQDVPARTSPQMGWEGANVIFDSWVHPLMMGLEEHLIGMFRHDFEFVDGHLSHLEGASAPAKRPEAPDSPAAPLTPPASLPGDGVIVWSPDGEAELAKIPFFVRGKVRKNTEAYAREQGLALIDSEALYEAKAHFGS